LHVSNGCVDARIRLPRKLEIDTKADRTVTGTYLLAKLALTALTDSLAASPLPELQTFRRTLMRWRREIRFISLGSG
jgi:hypothetical protein